MSSTGIHIAIKKLTMHKYNIASNLARTLAFFLHHSVFGQPHQNSYLIISHVNAPSTVLVMHHLHVHINIAEPSTGCIGAIFAPFN